MKKIFSFVFGLAAVLLILSGCGKSVADQDISKVSKENNQIIWGVKYDTRLFGMMDVTTNEVKGFDIEVAGAITE